MHLVKCKLLNQELPGLERTPFPGAWGEKIFNQISSRAWEMWLEEQTRIINEHRLDLSDGSDRDWVFEVMIGFLFGERV